MSKRGTTRPWRVRFAWDHMEIKGVDTFHSLEDADICRNRMVDQARRHEWGLHVTVEHRVTGVISVTNV